jgi:hypothetical protein
MAYRLDWRVKAMSVVQDDTSHGRVQHGRPPNIEDSGRIEQEVMIFIAGWETEGHWAHRSTTDRPEDWGTLLIGWSMQDRFEARRPAIKVTEGSLDDELTEAYLEQARQRVLDVVGRVTSEFSVGDAPDESQRRQTFPDPLYWRQIAALADAVEASESLSEGEILSVLHGVAPA